MTDNLVWSAYPTYKQWNKVVVPHVYDVVSVNDRMGRNPSHYNMEEKRLLRHFRKDSKKVPFMEGKYQTV